MLKTASEVVGRDGLVNELAGQYIKPMAGAGVIIQGMPGTGKSSIMASLANKLLKETDKLSVFYHFVGAVPGSTDLQSMLSRLLIELGCLDSQKPPKGLDEVMALARSALSNSTNLKQTVVIVDAVNQFDDVQDSSAPVAWLPQSPAQNVTIFVSVTPESEQCKLFQELLTDWHFIPLQPLPRNTKEKIVQKRLAGLGKELDGVQMELILNKSSSDNPMWLTLACECLQDTTTLKEATSKIRKLPDGLLELEEEILKRSELRPSGMYFVAALCFLECSVRGLCEHELKQLLKNVEELPKALEETISINVTNRTFDWLYIEEMLKPFIRPYGSSAEGRLDFHHRSFSKAVRKRYFLCDSLENEDIRNVVLNFFHEKMEKYFGENSEASLTRRIEEYPTHAWRCGNVTGLVRFLSNWDVFDIMYDAEFSRQLSKTWALVFSLLQSSGGSDLKNLRSTGRPGVLDTIYERMEQIYESAINKLQMSDCDEEIIVARLEKVCRVFMQNGRFDASIKLADSIVDKMERHLQELCALGNGSTNSVSFKNLNSHCEPIKRSFIRYASSVFLKAEALDEYMRSVDYILKSHLPKITKLVSCFEESLTIFKQLCPTDRRIGHGLNRVAFHYSGISVRGGTENLTATEAKQNAIERIEEAIQFYGKLGNEMINLADCYITRGVCEGSANQTQCEYYLKGLNLVIEQAGFFHPLLDRAYLNLGIYKEEAGNYEEAYKYFRKWYKLLMTIYGASHPRSLRAIRILNEESYKQVATYFGHQTPTITHVLLVDGETQET